jgi:hypothetical protein
VLRHVRPGRAVDPTRVHVLQRRTSLCEPVSRRLRQLPDQLQPAGLYEGAELRIHVPDGECHQPVRQRQCSRVWPGEPDRWPILRALRRRYGRPKQLQQLRPIRARVQQCTVYRHQDADRRRESNSSAHVCLGCAYAVLDHVPR